MKLRQSLIAALICLGSASGFAMGNPDSPECKYWAQQLISLEERIAKTQDKLEQCEQTSYDCHELKQLIISLKMEKRATETFLRNNCL